MEISVAQLEQNFETYLDLAEAGREVIVCRDGVPLVQMVPVDEAEFVALCSHKDSDCPICRAASVAH